jgi:hypothetical protein
MNIDDVASEVVEAILTKLSFVPVVGDALEAMTNKDYDNLEEELNVITRIKIAEIRN